MIRFFLHRSVERFSDCPMDGRIHTRHNVTSFNSPILSNKVKGSLREGRSLKEVVVISLFTSPYTENRVQIPWVTGKIYRGNEKSRKKKWKYGKRR